MSDTQERCVRCWMKPRAQPIMLTEADVIDYATAIVNDGCFHPLEFVVSFDEFCALAKIIREKDALRMTAKSLARVWPYKIEMYGPVASITVACRPAPRPLPFPMIDQKDGEPRTRLVSAP